MSDINASPINAIPPVIGALVLVIFGVEVLLWAGSQTLVGGSAAVGWRLEAINDFSFLPKILGNMIETGCWTFRDTARFVTYPFVHGGFLHATFVIVFLLALGKMVSEVVSQLAALVVFFSSAIVGALAYSALTGSQQPLVGGYPAVYGLIGAFTFLLWVRLGAAGAPQYRAFSLIGFLLGIQLFFGLIFGSGMTWVAEVAGFCTGFAVTPLVAPGGFARLVAALKRR